MSKVQELSALMVDTHRNVYEAAASLFDSNTTLDLNDEYARGVTEMVLRVVGIDSDYKDEVAEAISEFTVHVDHENIARDWIRHHGAYCYAEMEKDLQASTSVTLSDKDLATIKHLIAISRMQITFPSL